MSPTEVSIIIPCYNAEDYVREAIESVLSQERSAQIIVVDDGSTDNTLQILSYFSSDIQILQSEHKGVAVARNKAIEFVRSRYALLLDADDALAPGALDSLLRRASNSDSIVVYGNFSSWDSLMSKKQNYHKTPRFLNDPLSLLVQRNISPPGAILFSSDAFEKVGDFDQSVAACEDWDFIVRLARAGYCFKYVNKEVFYYRRIRSSASNQANRMLSSGLEVVHRCHRKDIRIKEDLFPDGYRRNDLENNLFYYYAVCMGLASLSDDADCVKEIIQSIKLPPTPDWRKFGNAYRLSLWWNSLAIVGNKEDIICNAQINCVQSINELFEEEIWCKEMAMSIISPDFRQLIFRPGPKKALRLYREFKLAKKIIEKM